MSEKNLFPLYLSYVGFEASASGSVNDLQWPGCSPKFLWFLRLRNTEQTHYERRTYFRVLTLQTMCTFFSLGLKRKTEIYLYRSCTHSWVHFPYLTFGIARSSSSCPSQWQDLRTLQENNCACLSLCLCLHGLVPQL